MTCVSIMTKSDYQNDSLIETNIIQDSINVTIFESDFSRILKPSEPTVISVTTFGAIFLALSRNARALDNFGLVSAYFGNLNVHLNPRRYLNDHENLALALYTFVHTMTGHVPGHCANGHPTPQINPFASLFL